VSLAAVRRPAALARLDVLVPPVRLGAVRAVPEVSRRYGGDQAVQARAVVAPPPVGAQRVFPDRDDAPVEQHPVHFDVVAVGLLDAVAAFDLGKFDW